MCQISVDIKLCTCSHDNIKVTDLDHYWVLFRYNPKKEIEVVGLAMPPFNFDDKNYIENQSKIAKCLDSGNAFDRDFIPKEYDLLLININSKNKKKHREFKFEYDGEEWSILPKNYDPFDLENEYDNYLNGRVEP